MGKAILVKLLTTYCLMLLVIKDQMNFIMLLIGLY